MLKNVDSRHLSPLIALIALALIANCGSKDPMTPPPPGAALKTDTLVLGEIGPYWPAIISGDCEFNGHGPFIRLKARLYVQTDSLMCNIYMYARETEANWSTAEGSWVTLLYRAPTGWLIAEILAAPDSCETTYIDNGGGYDYNNCPPFRFRSLGDTGGNDICGNTADDTHTYVGFDTLLVRLREF